MAGYLQQNRSAIRRGFNRLRKDENTIIKKGMVEIAKAGLEYLVDAHNQHSANMLHPHEENTMAYAIAHDGTIVKAASYKGKGVDDLPGDAMNMATGLLSGTSGWVAVILSEMEGWYRVDYENGFLQYSADQVRTNFHRFFKPVGL